MFEDKKLGTRWEEGASSIPDLNTKNARNTQQMWVKWDKVLHFKEGFIDFVKAWCSFRKQKFGKGESKSEGDPLELLGDSLRAMPRREEA